MSLFPQPPPHTPNWSLNPLDETLLQPVLKSFITVLAKPILTFFYVWITLLFLQHSKSSTTPLHHSMMPVGSYHDRHCLVLRYILFVLFRFLFMRWGEEGKGGLWGEYFNLKLTLK